MKSMNPTLRQCDAFVLACEIGSITGAAERMGLTQSAVSVLIRQLEAALGARLFDRTTRALRPTAAGREALPAAQRILRDRDLLVTTLRGVSEKKRGRVSFAVTAAVASALMPAALQAFRAEFPEIEIDMRDVAPDQLVPKLLAEDVEFSIGTVTSDPREFTLETLVSDRLSAICRRDSPMGRRRELTWDEVLRVPSISVAAGSGIRTLIDATLARRGKRLTPAWEVAFLATALSMTAQGLGISIMPGYLVAHLQYPTLVAVPLRDPVVRRNLTAIWRAGRSLSPAARSFLDVAKNMIVARG